LLRREADQLVQRIARAAAPAWRGAGERQALDLPRMAEREFLRHHAAEGDAEYACALPADRFHHVRCVVGVVGHAVGPIGLARLAEPALVVGEEGETLGQRAFEHAGLAAEVAIGAGDDEEARALAALLVEQPDIAALDKGHEPPLLFGAEPVLVSAVAPVNRCLPKTGARSVRAVLRQDPESGREAAGRRRAGRANAGGKVAGAAQDGGR